MSPTFGVPHGLVVGLIAGGPGALLKAVEGAEDNKQLGEDDLRALNLTAQDSGRRAGGFWSYAVRHWWAGIRQTDGMYHGGHLL